jgi:hypothetical protein
VVGGGMHLRLVKPESPHELRDCERLCATGEAFIYAAMSRLMVRRLARAWDLLDGFSRSIGG